MELSVYIRYSGLSGDFRSRLYTTGVEKRPFLKLILKRKIQVSETDYKLVDILCGWLLIHRGRSQILILNNMQICWVGMAAYSCSHESLNTSRHMLELRYPYRDRRLIRDRP